MTWKPTTVALVGGETVTLALGSVCIQNQIFVRMGERLVAGVVQDPTWQGIYIWQEVDGVYQRLGDIVFKEQGDGSVIWDAYPWTHNSRDFEARAAGLLAEGGRLQESGLQFGSTSGNHVRMLSAAPGVCL